MSPKTPIVPTRAKGTQTTPGDRSRVGVSSHTETAEVAAREMGDVSSNVNLKILDPLTAIQERMARFELSQQKREEDERKLLHFSPHL